MSTSVGQQLRQARETLSISIEQAALATRIRAHYLKALEAGDYSSFPSTAHVRGFLRAYAEYLGIDSELIIADLEGASPSSVKPKEQDIARKVEKPSPSNPDAAKEIFIVLGERLKNQRELLGLTHEEVEEHTHLRWHYLQALEAGNLDGLPSPVQGRGMLNNYATFLGLDPEPLLLQFADGLQAKLAAKRATQTANRPRIEPKQTTRSPTLRWLLSGEVFIGIMLAVCLLIFVLWGAIRTFSMVTNPEITSTAPSIADVLLATSTPIETSTPLPPDTQSAPTALSISPIEVTGVSVAGSTPIESGQAGVQINIAVRQRAYMRVIVDGEVIFEGRVLPGSAYPFSGDRQIEVVTGNGAGLQVNFNGEDQGVLGSFGQVADRIYTPQGVLVPTPTITSTPQPAQPSPGITTAAPASPTAQP